MSKTKTYGIIWSGVCELCGLSVSGSGTFIPKLDCPNVVENCEGVITMHKKLWVDDAPEEKSSRKEQNND